jgi:hypothetical protein
MTLPAPGALAQRVWDSLFLTRVEVVRVNFDDLPDVESFRAKTVSGPGKTVKVGDPAQAERLAGFKLGLPAIGILGSPRAIGVISPIAAQLDLRAGELTEALRQAGVSDMTIPKEWDGASLRFQTGPLVMTEYPDNSLLQCRPFAMVTPTGFQLDRFAEVAFRILGLRSAEARYLSRRFAANPAWLLGIPLDEPGEIREVELRSGSGILIDNLNENGQSERVEVVWNTADRIYALSGKMSRELAIQVANSVHK